MKGLIQESLDEHGKWKLVEIEGDFGGCPREMHFEHLAAGHYWDLVAPRYTGSFKTKVRFRLRVMAPYQIVWSNEFEEAINPDQFKPPPWAVPRGR